MRLLPVLLVAFLSTLFQQTAPGQGIPLTNAGFEQRLSSGMPAGWEALPSGLGGQPEIRSVEGVSHEGKSSLMIHNPMPASVTLVSQGVHLSVGKMYRLSGWVKTENAFTEKSARYPTPVAATISMTSFPFTNSAPGFGATRGWTKVEVVFFATRTEDQVRIHFGFNGTATGTAWFDDLALEEVNDITQYVRPETVRWFGPAFRYTDNGWIMVHIEGKPYDRGYQYGYLLGKEMTAFMEKLALRTNPDNVRDGWAQMRTLADALMLRGYDKEYLEEMKGIADGAVKAGASMAGKGVDLLDVVTLNSAVDLGQLGGALAKSSHPLSGRSFRVEEEEMNAPERLHKCSSFLANGPATPDGKIVFGQLFMWGGYTGVHWNVIADVVPSTGHRFVYQTFPGGIHSGTDFYINDAGIMLGETTVMQTPFNPSGTPQSSRIRKAAQYAESIDDAVKILTERNNGLYTNDWLIGDIKRNETAILLLGTEKFKLWRSTKGDFPGGTEGFYWSVNNAKDPEVRKEYVPDPSNAPFDVVFSDVNRDISFTRFYEKQKGHIDASAAVNVLATSPINRPHACDGKVTTSEMAAHLMFLAHYGKVTLREKFPEKGSRLMPDYVNSIPHLTLGYTVVNPIFIAEKLKALKEKELQSPTKLNDNVAATNGAYSFEKKLLWSNTVYPAADADNWFSSATAAYWNILNNAPQEPRAAAGFMRDQFAELNCRLMYTISREGSLAPAKAERRYDGFKNYIVPRVRGTFALHQLRLLLGNQLFSRVMDGVHARYRNAPMSTAQFIAAAEKTSGRDLRAFVMQWLDRNDMPDPVPAMTIGRDSTGWSVHLRVGQSGSPYHFMATVAVETKKDISWRVVEVSSADQTLTLHSDEEPIQITFNAGNDIPVPRKNFYTLSNFFDDFTHTIIISGTSRQIEANTTLAQRYQTVLADAFTELLPPIRKDGELSDADLAASDLIVLGGSSDNTVMRKLTDTLGLILGKNTFVWQDKTYGDDDDGLFVALPNPYNRDRTVYLLMGNSALELYHMTKRFQGMPSWAVFKGDQIVDKGYHPVKEFQLKVKPGIAGF